VQPGGNKSLTVSRIGIYCQTGHIVGHITFTTVGSIMNAHTQGEFNLQQIKSVIFEDTDFFLVCGYYSMLYLELWNSLLSIQRW
jgi:hypothetical protein